MHRHERDASREDGHFVFDAGSRYPLPASTDTGGARAAIPVQHAPRVRRHVAQSPLLAPQLDARRRYRCGRLLDHVRPRADWGHYNSRVSRHWMSLPGSGAHWGKKNVFISEYTVYKSRMVIKRRS